MNESQNARASLHKKQDTATFTPVSRLSASGTRNSRTHMNDETRTIETKTYVSCERNERPQAKRTAPARRPAAPSPRPTVVIGGVPFEETKESKKKSVFALSSSAPRVRTIRSQSRTPFPMALMFALLLCTGLFMYMIYNFVQINEQSGELKQMQAHLEDLTMQQQSLKVKLENRNDSGAIADMAENDLGMVKMDEVDKTYLSASGEDKVDVIQSPEEEEEVGIFSTLLNAVVQNLSDFAEYID